MIALALLLLLPLALAESPDRSAPPAVVPPPPPPWPAPAVYALSDGKPVWIIERHDQPLVRIELSARRGSADLADPLGARMAQALLDRGTTRREAQDWQDALDAEAATVDLGMGALRAWADVEALAGEEEAALRLALEAFVHPAFDRQELRRTRKDWRTARAEAWTSSAEVEDAALRQAVYPADHPLGARTIPADYRRLRKHRVQRAWKELLTTAQPAILVVGDVTPAHILPLLEATWAGALPGRRVSPPLPAPPPTGLRLILVDQPGTRQTMLSASLPGLPADHPEAPAQLLAIHALGGSFTSRLNSNLREDKGYTYGADAWLDTWPGHSRIRASTSVGVEHSAAALQELIVELDRMASAPPSPAEVEAARNGLFVSGARALDSLEGAAWPFGLALSEGAPPNRPRARVEALAATRPEEVAATAARLFGSPDRVIVIVGDREQIEPALDAAGLSPTAIWDRKRLILERRAL